MFTDEQVIYDKAEKYWLFVVFNLFFQVYLFKYTERALPFLIPWALYLWIYNLNLQKVGIICCITWAFLFLIKFFDLGSWNLFDEIKSFLNLQTVVSEYVESKHDQRVSGFINLFIFNSDKSNNEIYKEFKKFGIVHLIVISGFHIVCLKKVVFYFLRFFKLPITIVEAFLKIFLFFYWWAIGFSISGLRPVMSMHFKGSSPLTIWSKCCLFAFFTCFDVFFSYGFLLSFGIAFLFLLIDKLNKDKTLSSIYKNLSAFAFSHLLLLPFTKKIFFLNFCNYFLFFPIILFLFFYYLLFSWFQPFNYTNILFLDGLEWFMKNIELNKAFYPLPGINQTICLVILWFSMLYVLYLSYFYKRKKYNLNLEDCEANIFD